MINPMLFDTIELLVDLPKQNLQGGMQGAIVHQYNSELFEVEFANSQGETLALYALPKQCFIVMWQASTQQAVSIIDQIAQITARLAPTPQTEILNFARTRAVQWVGVAVN